MAAPEPQRSEGDNAELMSAYLDAELDPSDAEAFESFLADSPEAREELEELRKVVSLVATLPKVEAPEDFYEQVSRRLRRRTLLSADGLMQGLVSLPFQVLSIVMIMAIAAIIMMLQVDKPAAKLEREPVPVVRPPSLDEAPVQPPTP